MVQPRTGPAAPRKRGHRGTGFAPASKHSGAPRSTRPRMVAGAQALSFEGDGRVIFFKIE